MGFIEEFVASLETLPGVQTQNEQRCEQELVEFRLGVQSGRIPITSDPSKIKFSEDALEEQSHCVRIADEKVALATQAYDMVDAHIQQLDLYMRKLAEIQQEKQLELASAAAAAASPGTGIGPSTPNTANAGQKFGRSGERGRGGRKKSRLAAEPVVPPIDLELPVDPNEPTYCLCNQISYGEMVACDNANCKIEWFHFGCVGLKEHPKGKWYCNDCATLLKRKKGSAK
ncbi:RING/FYVE/PHD zinc finger superfamily protein isoform X2 [Carex rostrata]